MEINIKIVQRSELEPVYMGYYTFFEKLRGKTMASKFTKYSLEKGDEISPLMRIVDSNYNETINAISEAFQDMQCVMLGAYSFENELLAVGRIKFGVPDDKSNAIVGEIIILNERLPEEERTELYGMFVTAIEKTVIEALKDIELLTFEVPIVDNAFKTAIDEQGYDLDENEVHNQLTYLFDKRIRERQLKRVLEKASGTEE